MVVVVCPAVVSIPVGSRREAVLVVAKPVLVGSHERLLVLLLLAMVMMTTMVVVAMFVLDCLDKQFVIVLQVSMNERVVGIRKVLTIRLKKMDTTRTMHTAQSLHSHRDEFTIGCVGKDRDAGRVVIIDEVDSLAHVFFFLLL